jgi:hypothetical protein
VQSTGLYLSALFPQRVQWNAHPACRFAKLHDVYLYQVMEGGPCTDGQLLGRVALVQLVVEIKCDLNN